MQESLLRHGISLFQSQAATSTVVYFSAKHLRKWENTQAPRKWPKGYTALQSTLPYLEMLVIRCVIFLETIFVLKQIQACHRFDYF